MHGIGTRLLSTSPPTLSMHGPFAPSIIVFAFWPKFNVVDFHSVAGRVLSPEPLKIIRQGGGPRQLAYTLIRSRQPLSPLPVQNTLIFFLKGLFQSTEQIRSPILLEKLRLCQHLLSLQNVCLSPCSRPYLGLSDKNRSKSPQLKSDMPCLYPLGG